MSQTLIASKPKLTKDIYDCANEAMYEAFMTGVLSSGVDPSIAAKIKADMEVAGRKYAQKFAEKLSTNLADAIYSFVKEISIILTPSGSLIAPQAVAGALPVTGVSSTEIGDIKVV